MSTPFLSEIKLMAFNFAPKGWALANGQLLPINQNQALFSLLGTTYGGDGRVNFALPDLRSRLPIHMGSGFTLGQKGGEENHTLIMSEMTQHIHFMRGDGTTVATSNVNTPAAGSSLGQTIGVPNQGSNFAANIYSTNSPNANLAPQTVGNTGGSQAHSNQQPYLVISFCIALQGIFPSQN
jgi:microcystin-dependent protein